MDAGGGGSIADGESGPILDMAVDQPDTGSIFEALTATPEVQPDIALLVVTDAELEAPADTTSAVQDAQLTQLDLPTSVATLTADKASVDFEANDEGADGGITLDAGGPGNRPIKLGSSGVATVVVTNTGNAASGALAVVAGADVRTFGCTGALAPGATCSLTITATPTTIGQFNSTVLIWATPGAVTPILITVSATVVPPPLITSFVSSPTVVSSGGIATLIAVFSGGTGTVDQGIGSVTSGSGTSTGPISTPTTYTLTVTNAFGDSTTAQLMVYANGDEPCTPSGTYTGGKTGEFGTKNAFCFRTPDNITGWGCSNLTGRTLKVNGVAETCAALPLPAKINGYYYFDVTAGDVDYASIYWY